MSITVVLIDDHPLMLDGLEHRPSAGSRQDAAPKEQEVELHPSAEEVGKSGLGLEDNVIRELARSLRSWRK